VIAARATIALAIGMLLSGCLTRSPQVEFYTLGAPEASSRSRSGDLGGDLAVGVGPLTLPRYLDRPQLATRSHSGQIVYNETTRWAGPLADELLRVIGGNLSGLLPSGRVVAYPAQPAFPIRYRVVIDVERFEADPDDQVTLEVRWSIVPGQGGDALSLGRFALVEKADSGSAADRVAAHTAATAGLSRAIAKTLRSLSEMPEAPAPMGTDEVEPSPEP
jgi:uncharacterized lipoprotein YmbA